MERFAGKMMVSLRCAVAAIGLAGAAALPGAATAQANIEYRIEGGELRDALAAYARLTGRQLLFPSALVEGRRAPALQGRYGADEALSRLLAGSGLRYRRAGNAYVLEVAPRPRPRAERSRTRAAPSPTPSQPAASPAPDASAPRDQEIVITGTNIRGAGSGPAPVQVIERETIERDGFGNVADAIAALPQSFGGTGSEDTILTNTDNSVLNIGIGSSANLRGLGSDATLTLVNGRRLPGSGGKADFNDISLIPLAAVERIEVLTDGASAIYGADAIGGVVNIILRRDLEGGESRLRFGAATQGGAEEIQAGQVLGLRWPGGSALVAYEFQRRENLPARRRAFARSADLRPLGGSDFRSFFSNPGTIIGISPAGALVPRFAIPAGQDGTNLAPEDFMPGGNLQNQIAGIDLLPRQTRHSLFATARQEVAPGAELFLEGRYGRRRFSYASSASVGLIQATPANPFFVSPDGVPFSLIAYSFGEELGPLENRGTVQAWSVTGGASIALGADWMLDAHVGHARETIRQGNFNLVHQLVLAEAMGTLPDNPDTAFSAARDGFFNPYGDGPVNNRAVLDFIGQGYLRQNVDSALTSADIKLDGRLFDLPGGPVRMALGASWRNEDFFGRGEAFVVSLAPSPLTRTQVDRTVAAAFGEIVLPLFGPANARGGLERLELSAAMRYERYGDFGSSTNPRVGMVWEPTAGFRLRASYGRSFRAPALREVNDPQIIASDQLRDENDAFQAVIFLAGGNPDLGAERARSWTAGLQWQPPALSGLRFEATYFDTDFTDRISQPISENFQLALRDPSLAPFVRRIDPANNPDDLALVQELASRPGANLSPLIPPTLYRAIVDNRFVNTARVVVRGIDLLLAHRFTLGGGSASLALNASHIIDFQRQATPAAPIVERVDTVGNPPDLRLRLTGSWDKGSVGATLTLNRLDGYRDNLSIPERRVASWTTLDAQLRYRLDGPRWLAGTSLALSVQNLLDTDPPFVNRNSGVAYDSANAEPIGRFVALQIVRDW